MLHRTTGRGADRRIHKEPATKTFVQFALAAAALALAPAATAQPFSFTHDGVHFDGEETIHGGVRLLEGKDSTGAVFAMRVRGHRVTGTYRGSPVAFKMPVRALVPEKVASR